jgi:NADH-quinone oxidoreductase subunit L
MGGVFGDFTFIPDGLGVFLSVIATVIGSLAVIFSTSYMKGETQLGRYYAFVLFFIGAMVGLVLTSNIMLMFFFWEITALCSYALIAFHNDDPKAVKGGVKALIITSIGGVGLLLGALILYAYTGSFDIRVFIAAPSAPLADPKANPMPKPKISTVSVSNLAARRHGSTVSHQRLDPCSHDG